MALVDCIGWQQWQGRPEVHSKTDTGTEGEEGSEAAVN